LVIDPKPFIGDPAYDATPHLINCKARMRDAPHALTNGMAELLELDRERVRRWTFARFATAERCVDIAKAIAP
jgi:streptomycin 6-kinase